jgi:hypothetical protein
MEALRMASNIHTAFESLGRSDLAESLIALMTRDRLMAFLIKKGTYSDDELAKIRRFTKENGIRQVYLPGQNTGSSLELFIRTQDKARFIADSPRNISPTADDRPYFFNFTKWSKPLAAGQSVRERTGISQENPLFILSQLALSIVLSAVLIVFPAFKLRWLIASAPRIGVFDRAFRAGGASGRGHLPVSLARAKPYRPSLADPDPHRRRGTCSHQFAARHPLRLWNPRVE